MKILAIALALLIPFAFAATCEQQAVEPLVTLECTDATATSLTANAQVNKLEAGTLSRRGFVFMEGTTGTPSFNATPLVNSSFEEGDPPEGWLTYLCGLERSTEHVKAGSYSGKLTVAEGDFGGVQIRDALPCGDAEGRTFTFGMWVWSDAPDRVRVTIIDRAPGAHLSFSAYHPGDSNWHFLTVTRTLRTGLIAWDVGTRTTEGSALSYYVDGAVLVEKAVLEDGTFGLGEYSLDIVGLKPDTSYRVRSFVVDVQGIRYGNTVTCSTSG